MSSSLDCYRQSSLMLSAVSGDSSWKDLTSLRDVLSQLCYILVIDLVILFATEYTYFFSSASAASSLEACLLYTSDAADELCLVELWGGGGG